MAVSRSSGVVAIVAPKMIGMLRDGTLWGRSCPVKRRAESTFHRLALER